MCRHTGPSRGAPWGGAAQRGAATAAARACLPYAQCRGEGREDCPPLCRLGKEGGPADLVSVVGPHPAPVLSFATATAWFSFVSEGQVSFGRSNQEWLHRHAEIREGPGGRRIFVQVAHW